MNNYSEAALQSMGLMPHRKTVDEIISFSSWTRKADLHTLIRAQTTPAPPAVTTMWRIAKGSPVLSIVRCNMGICIMNVSSVIEGGGEEGADKNLPVEQYLCREEMGVWTMKYLTSAEGSTKNNAHLTQASDLDNYPIPKYNEFVPTVVWDSINKYKELYLAKYLPDNTTLT